MDRWMDGWMDGCIDRWTDLFIYSLANLIYRSVPPRGRRLRSDAPIRAAESRSASMSLGNFTSRDFDISFLPRSFCAWIRRLRKSLQCLLVILRGKRCAVLQEDLKRTRSLIKKVLFEGLWTLVSRIEEGKI